MSAKRPKKVTVRFSYRLKNEMQQAIIQSGYGLHGKSRWLDESIHAFLQLPNYLDLVENGMNINQADLTNAQAFYLNHDTIQSIKQAFVTIRIKYPLFEGIQSAFIRAAVIYRLMLNK